jgi:hypothetical protein
MLNGEQVAEGIPTRKCHVLNGNTPKASKAPKASKRLRSESRLIEGTEK